jgi:hypothetical protein
MTGQVKEDVITRFKELGVTVKEGAVSFEPYLLRRDEFLSVSRPYAFLPDDRHRAGTLEAGSLGFSLCGIPVFFRLAETYVIYVCKRVISSTNRNFEGRQGPGTRTHLCLFF